LITIFTIPKPFKGHVGIIQRNAIKSLIHLEPAAEIILMGDEEGVAETAREFNVKHISLIEKNEFGTPLLSSAFATVQKIAKNDILMYANADVIFFQDLVEAVQRVDKPHFLVCGRRWDLDIAEKINFDDAEWATKLKSKGTLHGLGGSDYFVFPKDIITMPPFIVGRQGWDNWLIYYMRMKKIPVIDATATITALHQNHDYSHSKDGEKKRVSGPELYYNINVAGGFANMFSLIHANWCLTDKGLQRPKFLRNIRSLLSSSYIWRMIFAAKMTIYEKIMYFQKCFKR